MDIELIPILMEMIVYLVARIILFKKRVLRKGHIALFYASMIGFFYFLPFAAFYGSGSYWNHVVWINFGIVLYAIVGTLSFSVNPLFPKGIVRTAVVASTAVKEQKESLRVDYEEQDMDSSVNLINHALKVLPRDISVIKNTMLKNGNNTMTFFNILVSPQAVYHLYPCNWGGVTLFTNTGGQKSQESAFDTQDFGIKSAYATDFLRQLFSSLKIEEHHIVPVIVLTNKTARNQGTPSNYKVVHVSALESFLREERDPHYSAVEMEEMKQILVGAKIN